MSAPRPTPPPPLAVGQRCGICRRVLDIPGDETSRSCGGDCLRCMAEAGDPDCIASLVRINAERHTRLERLRCFSEEILQKYDAAFRELAKR